ncbi:hypothetical protein AKO1_005907 [Acrasis kona]|uniref:Decapping nuclease n=1 Tax=Acrasis kona TaxID=1008807 RepID=A0AAW2YJD2_9EUKA
MASQNNEQPVIGQQQVISLRIGRTRFSAKRAVEALQISLQSMTQVSVAVVRGKLGQIEITGLSPSVFQVGMFILEDIILRERPVLYPLISFSFYQNQNVEYMFLPSANYHAKFQPKVLDGTNPIFFLKKLSKRNSMFLRQFAHDAEPHNSVWRLDKIRYETNSEEHATVREDDKLEFVVFVGTSLNDIQVRHHEFTTKFLSHNNPTISIVANADVLSPTSDVDASQYAPVQVCTFDMDRGSLMVNSDHLRQLVPSVESSVDANLNEDYDQVKSIYRIPIDNSLDPLVDRLMAAVCYSTDGRQIVQEAFVSGKPVIVSMRENIAKISCASYLNDDPKSSYEMSVTRQNNIITIGSPNTSQMLVDKLTYHNSQFAKACTMNTNQDMLSKSRAGNIWSHQYHDLGQSTYGQLYEFTKFCTVVKSRIGRHDLLIGGQVDAFTRNGPDGRLMSGLPGIFNSHVSVSNTQSIGQDIEGITVCASAPQHELDQYVEIKTCGSLEELTKEHYKRETLHPLFMQSYLMGTKHIVQGYVDKEKKGIVKKVVEKPIIEMKVDDEMVTHSMQFIDSVLNMLVDCTQEGKRYVLLFAPPSSHVCLLSSDQVLIESQEVPQQYQQQQQDFFVM